MSVDGKLTRHHETNVRAWTSAEDQEFFGSLLTQHDCIVMSRGTYEAVRQNIAHKANRLRVVLTSQFKQYENEKIPGKLDFRDQTPQQFVQEMKAAGKQKLLVVGGPQMILDFLHG